MCREPLHEGSWACRSLNTSLDYDGLNVSFIQEGHEALAYWSFSNFFMWARVFRNFIHSSTCCSRKLEKHPALHPHLPLIRLARCFRRSFEAGSRTWKARFLPRLWTLRLRRLGLGFGCLAGSASLSSSTVASLDAILQRKSLRDRPLVSVGVFWRTMNTTHIDGDEKIKNESTLKIHFFRSQPSTN